MLYVSRIIWLWSVNAHLLPIKLTVGWQGFDCAGTNSWEFCEAYITDYVAYMGLLIGLHELFNSYAESI